MNKPTTISKTLMLVALISGLTVNWNTNKIAPVRVDRPDKNAVPKEVPAEIATQKSKETHSWITYKTVSRSSTSKEGSVTVEYPRFFGRPTKGLDKLNRLMKKLVNMNMPTLEFKNDPRRCHFIFACQYKVAHASPDLISVNESFYSYTGGAHGNDFAIPFNYTMIPTGPREITIRNLFGKKTNLKALRKILRSRLKDCICPNGDAAEVQWIENGTESLNDLSCFTLNKRGVTFYFKSYQVTCYADGTPEIELTYGELKDLFDSSSPVYKYVQSYELLADANECRL